MFREFYKERDVVMEERRLSTESNPIGRMIEEFLAAAYSAHPYKQPPSAISAIWSPSRAKDAEAFFTSYYMPRNLTIALVGDCGQARSSAPRKYFKRLQCAETRPARTVEPPQTAERMVVIPDRAQPVYVEGYHRPDALDPDDAVYAAIAGHPLDRPHLALVSQPRPRQEDRGADPARFSGFPGDKYPSMMLFFADPGTRLHERSEFADRDSRRNRQDHERADRGRTRAEDGQDARAKANPIRGLANNQGLAIQLALGPGALRRRARSFLAPVGEDRRRSPRKTSCASPKRQIHSQPIARSAFLENSDSTASN